MREHLKEIDSELYTYSLDMDVHGIARDLRLIAGPVENEKPLNVGILMFSEKPEKYFPYARIEVVDIPDPTGTGMMEKTFTGPIQRQLKDALAFLNNYVVQEIVRKEKNRTEAVRAYNYPFAAIKEILSNAVYHRSYQVHEPITVRITPEAMEITSFPGFDRSITDTQIASYEIRSRIYRNRRIGDFLKEPHLIEGRNTGFPNVYRALRDNGSPMPIFEMDSERRWLSVTLPIHPLFRPDSNKTIKEGDYQDKIVHTLAGNPMTLTELAAAMGYKGITQKLRNAVSHLMTAGKLHKIAGEQNKVLLTVRK